MHYYVKVRRVGQIAVRSEFQPYLDRIPRLKTGRPAIETDVNGTVRKTAGLYPYNESSVIIVERYVLYRNRPAKMDMLFWL